jgi:hypothetical protein
VLWYIGKKALITPSFDGKVDGNILIAVILDETRCNGTYMGIVYNISSKKLSDLPVNIPAILIRLHMSYAI